VTPDDLIAHYQNKVREFLDESYSHLLRKSPDYEDHNHPFRTFRLSRDLHIDPWKGCLLRLGDKLSLLYTFVRDGTYSAHDEDIRETMMDIVVYSALTAVLYECDSGLDSMSMDVLLASIEDACRGKIA